MSRHHRRRPSADAQLEELYERVPVVECRGLCRDQCTVIDMSVRERERVAERGVTILPRREQFAAGIGPCAALTMFGRCSVYDVRPMICRIWGVSEGAECEHGCQPAGGYLPKGEALELLAEAEWVGGAGPGRRPVRGAEIRAQYEAAPQEVKDALQAHVDGGRL